MYTWDAPAIFVVGEKGRVWAMLLHSTFVLHEAKSRQTERANAAVGTASRLSLNEMFPPNQEQWSFLSSVIPLVFSFFSSYLFQNHRLLIHHPSPQLWNDEPLYHFLACFSAVYFTVPVTAYASSFIFIASMSTIKSISTRVGSLSSLAPLSCLDQCLVTENAQSTYVEEGMDRQADKKKAALQSLLL